jgi:hypothetical protein
MAGLTDLKPSDTYKSLLRINDNTYGVDDTLASVQDGEGTASCLELSTKQFLVKSATDIDATFDVQNSSSEQLLTIDTVSIPEEVIINEGGLATIDFRVEGDTKTHLLFCDASVDRVGIGTASPTATLEVEQSATGGVIAFKVDNDDTDKVAVSIEAANIDENVMDITADALTTNKVINISADGLTTGSALYIDSDSSSTSTRNIVNIIQNNASASAAVALRVQQDSTADIINVFDGATEVLTILDGGNVGIGTTGPSTQLHVAGGDIRLDSSHDIEFGGDATKILGDTTVLQFYCDSAERMRIDSSGNVGIGTSSPATTLNVESGVSAAGPATTGATQTSGTIMRLDGPDSGICDFGIEAGGKGIWIQSQNAGTLGTNYPIRLNENGGAVGIGTATPGNRLTVVGDPGNDGYLVRFNNTHGDVDDNDHILGLTFSGDTDASGGNFIIFADNDSTEMGVIKASSGSVVVDEYSDYRIKNTISTLSGGLDKINALRPVTFKYNDRGDFIHEGFIAHEVQEHVPYAVRGAKDAVNDDGSIKKQTFCIYQLIPQMVSAIKELSEKVTALENA